jgi:hypothetical protein
VSLADRLIAAANGDVAWRKALLLEAASAMSAGTAKTPQAVEGEARQRDPKGDANA